MKAQSINVMESENFVGFSTFIAYTNKFVSYEDFKANKRVINEAVSVFKAFYSRFDSRILRAKKRPCVSMNGNTLYLSLTLYGHKYGQFYRINEGKLEKHTFEGKILS